MNRVNDNSKKMNKASKAKRALAMREDKMRRVQVAKFRRGSILFFAVLLPVVVVILLALDYLYRPNSFALAELQFSGVFNRVQLEDVEHRTYNAIQGNFFTVNLEKIRNEVQMIAWVKDVNVRRKWPNSLVLNISEYIPQMRWGKEGWVSQEGSIVMDDSIMLSTEISNEISTEAPTLNGEPQYVAELFAFARLWQQQLAENDMTLRSVDRSSSSAWVIRFSHKFLDTEGEELVTRSSEMTLLLGSDEVQKRLDRFLRMYTKDAGLLQASSVVDARYPNGLAIVANTVSNSNENDATKRLSSL